MGPRFSLTLANRMRSSRTTAGQSFWAFSTSGADADAEHALVGSEVDPPPAGRAEQRGHQLVVRQHQQVAGPAQLGHFPARFLAAAAFRLEHDPQIALAIVADLFEEGANPAAWKRRKVGGLSLCRHELATVSSQGPRKPAVDDERFSETALLPSPPPSPPTPLPEEEGRSLTKFGPAPPRAPG